MRSLTVIAARRSRTEDVARFVAGFDPVADRDLRVILVDSTGSPPSIERPWLRVVSRPYANVPELRAMGLALADPTSAVAFVDAACRVTLGWLASARAAVDDALVACGPVRYGGGKHLPTYCAFLAEYGAFLPPMSPSAGAPGCNVVFRPGVLPTDGPIWKSEVIDQLARRGIAPIVVPAMIVSHRRPTRAWSFLIDRVQQGRCFAGRRRHQVSAPARLARACGFPIVGMTLLARLAQSMARKRRYGAGLVVGAPLAAVFLHAWAFGEAIGYLHGPGGACRAA